MRVVFRADATQASGAGHVMRCWALAEELQVRGVEVEWHSHIELPWVLETLARKGWPPQDPVGDPWEQAALVESEAVVVDSYDLDLVYRQGLLSRGIKVVAIVDDFHSVGGPASLWVNPGVKTPLTVADPRAFLNGPDFVLIRREVRDLRLLREEFLRSGAIPQAVTVLLGGNDAGGLAATLQGLPEALGDSVSLLMGPGNARGGQHGTWVPAGSDLLRHAALSRLVISAAGVSSWEMLHIGVPLALVEATANQSGNYRWMSEMGVAWPLGSYAERALTQSLGGRVKQVLAELPPGVPNRKPIIDGFGAPRVSDAIMGLVT